MLTPAGQPNGSDVGPCVPRLSRVWRLIDRELTQHDFKSQSQDASEGIVVRFLTLNVLAGVSGAVGMAQRRDAIAALMAKEHIAEGLAVVFLVDVGGKGPATAWLHSILPQSFSSTDNFLSKTQPLVLIDQSQLRSITEFEVVTKEPAERELAKEAFAVVDGEFHKSWARCMENVRDCFRFRLVDVAGHRLLVTAFNNPMKHLTAQSDVLFFLGFLAYVSRACGGLPVVAGGCFGVDVQELVAAAQGAWRDLVLSGAGRGDDGLIGLSAGKGVGELGFDRFEELRIWAGEKGRPLIAGNARLSK